jgi:hypothetical protein
MSTSHNARRFGLRLVVLLLLLAVVGGIAYAAVAIQMQAPPARMLIQGVPERMIQLPPTRMAQVTANKRTANLNVLRQSFVVRNGIPFIRGGGQEFELLPLSRMEYDPSPAEISVATRIPGRLVKYREYILQGSLIREIPDVVDHRPDQTPVKNQNPRGTCVCFGSMAGLEQAYGGGSLDLSEQYANYLYMTAEGRVCKDDGLQTHMSANYLSDHGVCLESVCGYQTSFASFCNNGASPPPTQRGNAEGNSPYRITGYQKLWRNDDLATDTGIWINNPRYLEALLRAGHDIVFGTHVAGWSYPYTGIIDVQLGPGGDPLPSVGGHAMLIVGYNRPQEYFIVKNSWGTDRGQDGYVYLSYDYIRTYAKYGYVITDVAPLPLQLIAPRLQRLPARPLLRQSD